MQTKSNILMRGTFIAPLIVFYGECMKIYFYYVKSDYIEYLKEYEKKARGFTCVPNVSYKTCDKFVFGAVMKINSKEFFVPVSSYSKYQKDVILLRDKADKTKILGSLRFAYMIPVPPKCLTIMDLKNMPNNAGKVHIAKELAFCRKNITKIEEQAYKTYFRTTNKLDINLIRNSCDFKLLEQAYINYCKENNLEYSGDEQTIEELTKNCSEWADKVIEKIERNRKAREDDNTIR